LAKSLKKYFPYKNSVACNIIYRLILRIYAIYSTDNEQVANMTSKLCDFVE